jgi:ribose 5-phosphate isomerase A
MNAQLPPPSTPADALKQNVALAALAEVPSHQILGIGTGSTVNWFIDALAQNREAVRAVVSSSEASTARLRAAGIDVWELSAVIEQGLTIPVYIDGADEINQAMHMIKGGGAALTREKIVAAACERFVCIADDSKQVDVLGKFPLPIEVIPMARGFVARQLQALGARPTWRQGVVTDNGNIILDAHDLVIRDPVGMESEINQWPGVVTVGLFAQRPADLALIGSASGVRRIEGVR